MANIDPTTPAGVQPAGFSSGWTLTFSDEFNANSLDPKWQVGSWYSASYGGVNYDTNNGGNSCFRMWPPGDVGVGTYNSHPYFGTPDNTIHTQNAFTQNGGFFEARMKLGVGVQCWPAFWIDNGSQNEIDFMEAYGQNGGGWGFVGGDGFIHSNNYAATSHPVASSTVFGSFKYGDAPPNGSGNSVDLSAAFHTYGFRWDAASGNGQSYFDGVPWGPNTGVGLPGGAQCWLILTLAFATFTGSASGGDPPRGSGNSFQVDWCRAWQPGGTGPSFSASLTSAPADGTNISGTVQFVIDGALIQNAELLPPTGYSPKYGVFTISGGGTHGVLNWDTTGVANGSISVRISAYNVPAGGTGGIEIVVVNRTYIINNNTGNLWVSTTGSDSNNGTSPGTPFLTITKAASVAGPNTTINVAAGNYTGSFQTNASGTSGQPITFVSTTKWGAKIIPPGSGAEFGWDQRGAWVVIDGFEVDGQGGSNTVWTNGIYIGGGNCIVKNCKVHDIATNAGMCVSHGGSGINGDSFYGGTNTTITENIVYNIGSTNCQFIHGIYFSTTGQIKNNLIYGVGGGGIQMWHDAHNIDVINNTIFHCRWGIIVGSGGYYIGGGQPNDNSHHDNNIIYDCSEAGFNNSGSVGTNNTYNNNCLNSVVINFQNAATGNALSATVLTNPTFVNYIQAGGGDYHLSAGSGCISAGLGTYAPSIDLERKVRTGITDIGCYDFSGTTPPPPPPPPPAQFTQEFFAMDFRAPWRKK